MKRHIPLILDTLAAVALALWLGGLGACWLALAPVVHAAPAGAAAAPALFAETLRRFSGIVESCGVILAALQWVLRRRYEKEQTRFVADGVRMLIVFIAFFCAEYSRYVLVPALLKAQTPSAFSALEAFAVAQAILLILCASLTIWLQTPQPVGASAAVPRPVPSGEPVRPTPQPSARPVRARKR